ncbi:MAG: hypothetical protein HRU19_26330 [Pseudobacteriovorax sp.]|nr:hypothetical protein [Pseudobacteriovorax sp.]
MAPPEQTTQRFQRPSDCREHIVDITYRCQTSSENSMTCNLDKKAADYLLLIYDELDEINQKMFCSIREINFRDQMDSIALAAPVFYSQNYYEDAILDGVQLSFHSSLLSNSFDHNKAMSWKEQKNFLHDEKERYQVVDDLPMIDWRDLGSREFIEYVLLHEFGHFFDFANGVNCQGFYDFDSDCDSWDSGTIWSRLSWSTPTRIIDSLNLFDSKVFCFYNCEPGREIFNPQDSYEIFEQMPFVTTYSMDNSLEDFAEVYALTILSTKYDELFFYEFSGQQIDVAERMRSQLLAEKREFVTAFLSRSSLRYP